MNTLYSSDSDEYSSSDDSSSDSSSSSDSDSDSDFELDAGNVDQDFEDLELLLADRAEELAIARSLGATYRVLEVVAETKYRGSKKMDIVINRVSKKMNLQAVRRKARQVREYVRALLSEEATATVQGIDGTEFSVTTDSKGRRQISRVESLEKELADLKALMAMHMQAG